MPTETNQAPSAFDKWSQAVSKEGPPADGLANTKLQTWKSFCKAEKRTQPTKGKVFLTRSYDEELSESNLGE